MKTPPVLAALATVTAIASVSSAQEPPPPPPVPYAPQVQVLPPAPAYGGPVDVRADLMPRKITDWEEGEPVPPGYRAVTRTRTGLVVGGAVTFGVTYMISAYVGAALVDAHQNGSLLVPVAGPFVMLGNPGNSAVGNTALVMDGLAQVAGAAMLIGGIVAPKMVLVRDYGPFTVQPTPLVGQHLGGVGLTGTF